VLLFDGGAVAGVDVRGSAPGTRETDLLQPVNTVERVNALVLSGGSAFGLDAATGVMRYLEEAHQGFRVGPYIVPIVPAAILFDLSVGDGRIRPDAESGYAACRAAQASKMKEGNVGAGAGATVGKFFGSECAMKGGLGTANVRVGKTGIIVGAIVAVNAVGDVFDVRNGRTLAGALTPDHKQFRGSAAQIAAGALMTPNTARIVAGANSTIGIVATNATMTKTQMSKVAQMAHDGFARSINPVHTPADGDTIFAAATGTAGKADVTTVGVAGAEAMAMAVRRAVLCATSIPGFLAHRDLPPNLR
jgi:L-aminopeptidase/D-esterase-like protein